jgi:two-component system chemotaxis response regulator CheB
LHQGKRGMPDSTITALVIDDSALYRKFVSSVLSEIPGVEVIGTASNGRLGLDKIRGLKPDFVTLDLEMPEMDGLAMLREMSVCGEQVPAIVISSLTSDGAKSTNTALQLGAFDFVLKPVGKGPEESRQQLRTELAPTIEACLQRLRRNARGSRPARPVVSQPSPQGVDTRSSERRLQIRRPAEVLVIGVSTGGPVALNRVLPKLPEDFPCPVLVVQHMPPMFTKSLADDLNRICPLQVREAAAGDAVVPGTILIAPGGHHMRVARLGTQNVIEITEDPPERNCRPAVDYLFRSVAELYRERAVGVILTGMGDDGTIGCRLLKKQGALILSQDEASCVVYGMPRSVYEAGLSDWVSPLDAMAGSIETAVRGGQLHALANV